MLYKWNRLYSLENAYTLDSLHAMKKTLTLLALTAALMPMIPLVAKGGTSTYWVTGIELADNNDWTTATGWLDANKRWGLYSDGLLCWAATCSNLATWWQQQNAEFIPERAPTELADVWNTYRLTFENKGGDIGQGLHWWLDGDYGKGLARELKPRIGDFVYYEATLEVEDGGFYKDSLWQGLVENQDLYTISSVGSNLKAMSSSLVSAINQGYGVGLSWVTPSSLTESGTMGHAVTVWGVDYDTESGLLTALYLTDSDDDETKLTKVGVQPNSDRSSFVKSGSTNSSIESFTVLNSHLKNDLNYFNYQDKDSHDITMKQTVKGEGYTISDEQQEIHNIKFDGSRGAVERKLKVEANNTAGKICVDATQGVNWIDVQEGVTLTAQEVTGGGSLTKKGAGTLKLTNKDGGGRITVQEGVLECENGTLAEITLSGNGTLHGGGKYGKVTVNGGTLAVGNSPGYQQYSGGGSLTLNQATLEFYLDGFNKESSSRNGSGWGNETYSNLDMYGGSIYVMNAEGIDEMNFYLGGAALETIASAGEFKLELITGIQNSYFTPDYADMAANTHFYVSDEAAAIAGTTWSGGEDLTEHFTVRYEYVQSYYAGPWQLNMVGSYTGVGAPEVPEPATSTLSLLALAGLCARRRRK